MNYQKGDIIEVDMGAITASPRMRGKWIDAEFIEGPNTAGQVYIQPIRFGLPLWVWVSWTREKKKAGT